MSRGPLPLWAINGLRQRGGVRQVWLAREPGHPMAPGDLPYEASHASEARLVVVLSGERRCRLMQDGQPAEIRVPAGGALWVAPEVWLLTCLEGRFTSLVISFQAALTRYCVSTFDESRARHRNARTPLKAFGTRFHHPCALDAEGRALSDLMAASPPRPSADPLLTALAQTLLLKTAEHLRHGVQAPLTRSQLLWQAACQFIEANCHRPINRSDVAQHLHVHPNHVSRLFRIRGRSGFNAHLRATRLRRACLLLKDRRLSLGQVATLCGFTSQSYFTRVFTAAFGHSPSRGPASSPPS